MCGNDPLWNQVIIGVSDGEVIVSLSGNTSVYADPVEYFIGSMSNHGIALMARYQFFHNPADLGNDTIIIRNCSTDSTNLTQQQFDILELSSTRIQMPLGYNQQRNTSLELESAEAAQARIANHIEVSRNIMPHFHTHYSEDRI